MLKCCSIIRTVMVVACQSRVLPVGHVQCQLSPTTSPCCPDDLCPLRTNDLRQVTIARFSLFYVVFISHSKVDSPPKSGPYGSRLKE